MSDGDQLDRFDAWIKDDSRAAALVMRQWLKPLEEAAFGDDEKAVIFPPTYATEKGSSPYNIDRFEDGTSVCQIDSVGSQANRMEPIFKRDEYKSLVPQVTVKTDNGDIDLLDAGHRAADAVVRFTFGNSDGDDAAEPLGQRLWKAYDAWQRYGDAETLARLAPTSIVFGSWDSRATQAKLPRIVGSVIRAYDVRELHRSAQYSTIAGQILGEGEAETKTEGAEAELGLAHVPSVKAHGGVEVHGGIRRDAMVNLVALRALGVKKNDGEDQQSVQERLLTLRRYVLGLSLVALVEPLDGFLREGCHLVPQESQPAKWALVNHDGTKEVPPELDLAKARSFAKEAAEAFQVRQEAIVAHFDPQLASDVLNMKKNDRKKLLRSGPVTRESLSRAASGRKRKASSRKAK